MLKLFYLFIFLSFYILVANGKDFWVDYSSPFTEFCGSKDQPCQALQNVIQGLSNSSKSHTIYVRTGIYDGYQNRDIIINSLDLKIVSNGGYSLIDCQHISFGFKIYNSKVELLNFIITNCIGSQGSALSSYNSKINQKQVKLVNNLADYGGASFYSKSTLVCVECEYFGNIAQVQGYAIYMEDSDARFIQSTLRYNVPVIPPQKYTFTYDIYLHNTKIIFIKSNVDGLGVKCVLFSAAFSSVTGEMTGDRSLVNICEKGSAFRFSEIPVFNYDLVKPNQMTSLCDNDGSCNGRETCLNCADCTKCRFSGASFWLYTTGACKSENGKVVSNSSCIVDGYPIPLSSVELENLFTISSSHGNITSYFKIQADDTIQFKLKGSNLGVYFYLNNINIIKSHYLQSNFSHSKSINIRGGMTNSLVISIFTSPLISRSSISLEITDRSGTKIIPFYSQNICGDGVNDPLEDCDLDDIGIESIKEANPKCGDGVCNEVPESCLQDCYDVIGKSCVSQVQNFYEAVPQSDTISYLINNNVDFSLPGLAYFAHGIDLITGEELPSVIFDIGYCDNVSYSTIQDFYRESIYNIPPEYYAEILPICSYDSIVSSHKSSSSVQNEQLDESSMSVSFSAGVDLGKWGGSADLAYSKSKSTMTAKSLETKESGDTISVKVKCITSTVTRNSIRFHKNFVRDIAKVKNVQEMANFIEKYGALYYTSSSLGGSLGVMIRVNSNSVRTQNTQEIKESAEISAGASLKTPYGGGSEKYTGSDDSNIKTDEQSQFEESTTKSRVLVRGGALGSFGPDYTAPSTFSEWAKSVDLRPVPIDYKVGFVGNIIPPSWKALVEQTICVSYINETGRCLSYNDNRICNSSEVLTCTVNATVSCTNFVNTTCVKNQTVLALESYQKLWAKGYDLYVKQNSKEKDPEVKYFLGVHLTYNFDAPSQQEINKMKNITIQFHGVDGRTVSVLKDVKLINNCNGEIKSCQQNIISDDIFGNFELFNISFTYENASNITVSLNVSRYFSDIIIHESTPSYSRGYLLNTSMVLHERYFNISLLDIVTESSENPNPNPEPYLKGPFRNATHLWYFQSNLTVKLGPKTGASDKSQMNYFLTNKTNQLVTEYYYLPPDPVPVMYPEPGKMRMYLNTIDFNPKEQFYVIMGGKQGVSSYPMAPKYTYPVTKYRPVFTPVGQLQELQFTFPDGNYFSVKDLVFVLWVCDKNSADCSSNVVASDQKQKGYINLVRADNFARPCAYIASFSIFPESKI
ncbi:hypothetical protein PPL_10531 [Heterostelium album PN500]|uniref:MACPF domain-containing protein n=1 Tax=Heterostelium pallidum (strain ATCC 26659 / Pp 5 / PN500) TaxID=670386 RepID=D3BRC3_HETP5|nr:hypothetical protein PPL_10531 [Heterostelium album PN500]EFA75955.1 hypothetical protein PPL_10531 [Heterostelium album PN500]|eukprot:XP_020428089.1 hypothetical protein PPL_10531 [Heterostelium album PN500]